jgi:outer membrane protein TolC
LPNINVGTNYDYHVGTLQQSNGNILKVNRDALYTGLGANAIAAGTVNIPGVYYNLNVGNTWFGILQSRQFVVRRRAETEQTQIDVFLKTCLAYTELLRAVGKRAVTMKNRQEVADVARVTASYAKNGQGRKADADRAAVELKRRDLELTQSEAEILTASARLCQLINLDPSTRLKPMDGWSVPAPMVPEPISLTELIAIALMQRPELAARRAEIREAIYGLSNAKLLPFSPNVIAGYSTGAFGGGSNLVSNGIPQPNGSTLQTSRFGNFDGRVDIDAVMYWTLQNLGVGNIAQIRIASSRARQSELRQLESVNRIRAEVAEAYARVHARYVQIDTMEQAVKISQEAFTADLQRTNNNIGLPIEVLDSARLLNISRTDYLDVIINYNRAHFELFAALGTPPAGVLARPVPADLVPPPEKTLEVLPPPQIENNKPAKP